MLVVRGERGDFHVRPNRTSHARGASLGRQSCAPLTWATMTWLLPPPRLPVGAQAGWPRS